MKALIFSAGLGTRLRPLTNNIPKALVQIKGKTLLEILIEKLKSFGFDEIIINVHHFSEKIINFLKEKNFFEIKIHISNEKDLLLDTGGGLKNARKFFQKNEDFLIYNVDIICDLDLKKLYNFHIKNQVLVSLAVQKRNSNRCLLFDENNLLIAWKNNLTNEVKWLKKKEIYQQFAFTGIHFVSSEIFNFMPEKNIFSIIDLYLNLAKTKKIKAFEITKNKWIDVGKPENLQKASKI